MSSAPGATSDRALGDTCPGGYAVIGEAEGPLGVLARQLGEALEASGIVQTDDPLEADLVLNLIDAERPRPFRRKSRGTFVAALYAQEEEPEDGLRQSYPLLVRALANVVLCYVPSSGVSFTTMERGHYTVPVTGPVNGSAENGGGLEFAHAVAERLLPLATSRLVIENEFRPDLEPELWEGDELTRAIGEAGRRLDALGLLPAPFPIEELLEERDLRHVQRLYGIGGLSYGNLSTRKDADRFWMSASGVDKGQLDQPNRDILLVTGYDALNARMILSVSPSIEPRRVSVDAIEHWIIYREHPDVNAILHVHAWMEGIAATDINYPCGTAELAGAVAELLAAEPDPAHAVIGLRNHGITATGESLGEILDRIEPSLLRQVPMS